MTAVVHTFQVTEEEKNERLDVFLTGKLAALTRSHIQKLIAAGQVTVKGKPAKANHKVQPAECVEVTVPDLQPLEVLPEAIPLDILFEDSEVIVVNKARGMVVHPAAGNQQGTLVNALLDHCGDLSGINGVIRPGIVHRLDKDTSGVMVVAKTDRAHLSLASQIKARSAGRKYLAVVYGNIAAEDGFIDAPIGRHSVDRKKMAVTFHNSREAKTHFHVLKRFGDYTLVECRLSTGRTHQIRVHMAHIGHPVVGDPKYGPKTRPFAIAGQALHSAELVFRHPATNEEMVFHAPLPVDMQDVLARIAKQTASRQ
ncbi:MAG: RluA family pseudouridine synthase [Negativicutes bacterium]|nr:RluA family pseudouridine synthase [Negativicutes bacterium]